MLTEQSYKTSRNKFKNKLSTYHLKINAINILQICFKFILIKKIGNSLHLSFAWTLTVSFKKSKFIILVQLTKIHDHYKKVEKYQKSKGNHHHPKSTSKI